jgi:hypothetical protein
VRHRTRTCVPATAPPKKNRGPAWGPLCLTDSVRLLAPGDVGSHFHRDFYDFEFRLGPHMALRVKRTDPGGVEKPMQNSPFSRVIGIPVLRLYKHLACHATRKHPRAYKLLQMSALPWLSRPEH